MKKGTLKVWILLLYVFAIMLFTLANRASKSLEQQAEKSYTNTPQLGLERNI